MDKNLEITKIRLTNGNEFVITARNEDNSMFYIRPKSDFERELELLKENEDEDKQPIVISPIEGLKNEEEIIKMMGNGVKFYTYNHLDETFTEVIEVDSNIKTESNETDVDNIGKLPILG